MKKLCMGVLGLGEGRSIISAVLQSEYWTLGNICDLNEELCQERCREFDFRRYTTRYEEMLEDTTIDVIGIYTPDQLHARHIKMALEAGKDVICTKPLMIGLGEAKELIETQKKSGRSVFVGQSSRYFETAIRQREDYEAGKLGELVTMEAHYISDSRWFLERGWSHQKGFSWMYNFMIHAVDLAAWYLPQIEEVFGFGTVSANTVSYQLGVPDTMKFLFRDRDGKFASVIGAYATPSFGKEVEQSISCTLRGTKGISRGGSNFQYYLKQEGEKAARIQDFSAKMPYYYRFEGNTHHAGEYQNYIEYFAREKQAGQTPRPDLTEGIHTLAIMEAMEKSLQSGQKILVSQVLRGYDLL